MATNNTTGNDATTTAAPSADAVDLLLPSLQCWCGMVTNNGHPFERPLNRAVGFAPEDAAPEHPAWLKPQLHIVPSTNLAAHIAKHELPSAPAFNPPVRLPPATPKAIQGLTPEGSALVAQCIAARAVPRVLPHAGSKPNQSTTLLANIRACTRADVTPDTLKQYIRTRKRIDIEQAAALTLSVLPPDAAAQLTPHLTLIFPSTTMWLTPTDVPPSRTARDQVVHNHLLKILYFLSPLNLPELAALPTATATFPDVLPTLLRIRRKHPSPPTRCLRLPAWLFALASTPAPPHIAAHPSHTGPTLSWPTAPHADPIVLSRTNFRRIDRILQRLCGPTDPPSVLWRNIQALETNVGFGLGHLDTLLATNDTLALAFSFFALQRRLQPKVVSDLHWTAFLAKGESRTLQQNTCDIPTSFELALARLAVARPADSVDWDALTAVTIPRSLEGLSTVYSREARVLQALDEACLLAEQYVVLHGQGVFENLTFGGVSGGSGRGPVDQYNLLVDIIRQLKCMWSAATSMDSGMELDEGEAEAEQEGGQRMECDVQDGEGEGTEEGAGGRGKRLQVGEDTEEELTRDTKADPLKVLGKCHKFLAKDIMAWNNAWGDDAFANGKRPGWVRWLKLRRLQGVLPVAEKELV